MCKSELIVTCLFNKIVSNTFPNFGILGNLGSWCLNAAQGHRNSSFLLNYLWVDFKRKVLTALQKSNHSQPQDPLLRLHEPADLFSTRINQNSSLRRGNENREMWGWFKPNWTPISSEDCLLFLWKMLKVMSR